jgi:exonuclease SbcC
MRIESIQLEDIRSYNSSKVSFGDGLMLMYGENGAGKSSLLSSIFCGMYMSDVLSYMGDDINLDSLVRREQDEGSIKIVFSIDGEDYTIEWKMSVKEDGGNRSASTKKCQLTGTDVDEPIEGVRAVRSYVEELIGLGPESFVNSVYVQQGNIARIIEADGSQRKEIVDGLLGLSRLDTYIDRMDKVRVELGAQRKKHEDLLDEKERQLSNLPNKSEVNDNISQNKKRKKQIEDKIENKREKVDKIEDKIRELQSKIDNYNEVQSEIEELRKDVQNLEERRSNLDDEREAIKKQIETIRDAELKTVEDNIQNMCDEYGIERDRDTINEEINTLEDRKSGLETEITRIESGELSTTQSEIESHRDDMNKYDKEIQQIEEKIESKNNEIESLAEEKDSIAQTIESMQKSQKIKFSRLQELTDLLDIEYEDIDDLDDRIPDIKSNHIDRVREIYKDFGRVELKIEQFDELLDNNTCPVCGREHDTISGTIKRHKSDSEDEIDDVLESVEAIDNQKENLDELSKIIDSIKDLSTRKKSKETLLKNKDEQVQTERDRLQSLQDDLDETKSLLNETKSDVEQKEERVDEIKEKINSKENQKQNLESEINKLSSIESDFSTVDKLERRIRELQKDVEQKKEIRENVQKNYLEKSQKLRELENNFEDMDVSKYKSSIGRLRDKKSSLLSDIDSMEEESSGIQEDIAEQKQTVKQIERIKKRKSQIEKRKEQATSQEKDAEDVIQSYEEVKSKLRKENIGLLNKYSNDVFNAVYDNKVYQKLEIDEEYNITLVTGDNVRVDPSELSGGEMTLVSLAIRAGVYRLLVERQGGSDTLPPFILDEPTTYLDDTHVSNLQNVIDKINSWDVSQVFIISHREDMIQNADSAYKISKDPSTETSSVERKH